MVRYAYDGGDPRFAASITASLPDGTPDAGIVSAIQYGVPGRPSSVSLANGVTNTYGYDPADRLTGILDPTGMATLYRLNASGSRLGQRTIAGYIGVLDQTAYASAPASRPTTATT